VMICDRGSLRRRLRESVARRKRQEKCARTARKTTEWASKFSDYRERNRQELRRDA